MRSNLFSPQGRVAWTSGCSQGVGGIASRDSPGRRTTIDLGPGEFASEMTGGERGHGVDPVRRIPARRVGIDDDMAGAAVYLAPRAGSWGGGETLVVDGGVAPAKTDGLQALENSAS